MQRDDDAYLLDMLLAAREGVTLACGLTFVAFQQNRMAQLAIQACLTATAINLKRPAAWLPDLLAWTCWPGNTSSPG